MSTTGRKSSINKQDYNTPQKYVDAILGINQFIPMF